MPIKLISNTTINSNSSSNNSSSIDEESQCLMTREIISNIDSCMVGMDNGLDEPEVTFRLSTGTLSKNIILFEQVSESEDTSVKWNEMEQIMVNYTTFMKIYERAMTENLKLTKKLQLIKKSHQFAAPTEVEMKLTVELKKSREEHTDQTSMIQKLEAE